MVKYQRLTIVECEEISRQIASGLSLRKIALRIDRAPSTISRELRRCVFDTRYYRAVFAQQRGNVMRHKVRGNRKLTVNKRLRTVVFHYLAKNWSPEQIAKRLIFLYPNDMSMHISHESIYSYIYILPRGMLKKRLIAHLRRSHIHRRKKNSAHLQISTPIQNYLSIEERPQEVADRIIPGHWEGDLIIGRRNASAIGTLVERTTRFTFLVKLDNQDSMTVRRAFVEEFRQIPAGLKRTLTYDQGREMAQHKLFSKETEMAVYFAHPNSPWERGTNENTNALIRQYFPRGTDFSKISKNKLKEVQDELNDRPRKTLGWFTPHEKLCSLLH